MHISFQKIIIQKIRKMDLFQKCFTVSFVLHFSVLIAYYISTMPSLSADDEKVIDSNNVSFKNVEVDFIDLPPSIMMGGDTNPAPVEKQEWIEGTGKDRPDAENTDVNINKLSGTGTDPDGYMFADLSDHPPIPIIDFNVDEFFPRAARSANITRQTVVVQMQVNNDGTVKSAKVISGTVGYGFEEAAMKVAGRLRFRPGKIKGRPTKMLVKLPIMFKLED